MSDKPIEYLVRECVRYEMDRLGSMSVTDLPARLRVCGDHLAGFLDALDAHDLVRARTELRRLADLVKT